MRPFIPPDFRADACSIIFLLGLWMVIFGDDALDAVRGWWRRRVCKRGAE